MQIAKQLEPYQEPQPAEIYYHDKYSEIKESTFTIKRERWKNIRQNNSSGNYLTDKEIEYIAILNGFLRSSSPQVEYFTKEYLCKRLRIGERQLSRLRKNTSHIFTTQWKKRVRSYRGTLEKVYAIRPTEHTAVLLGESKHYRSVKVGHQCLTSIYKDEKNIKRNRSNVLNNSFSSSQKTPKISKPPKPRKFYQNQYDKPKTLPEESPINDQEEAEVYKLSGKMFEKKFLNESLKNMVNKGLQKLFHSRRQFIVWFSKCMLHELRSVEHTNKTGFYIKGNKTEAEIVEHTTMNDRERYLNQIENEAIHHRNDETQLKAKWAGTLATNTAYNLLKNLSYWRIVGRVMEIYLQKRNGYIRDAEIHAPESNTSYWSLSGSTRV